MPGPPSLLSSLMKYEIDKNTLLCFACSSSLPPPKKSLDSSTSTTSPGVFTTPCCQRLICNQCITMNPRLQRYNPCLACLRGVGVVGSPTSDLPLRPVSSNFDGAVRDEDTFVLGNEDDSDYENETEGDPKLSSVTDTSLSTRNAHQTNSEGFLHQEGPTEPRMEEEGLGPDGSRSTPLRYYIAQSDTFQGIVLRFGLDGHEVCRLNNLPPSILKTTPHLLHTRRYLLLPPLVRNSRLPVNTETPEQAAAREAKWGKERAEKRLQTLMKETDWYVAKAYVALADDPVEEIEEQEKRERKGKEYGSDIDAGPSNLEERAIRKYLDDDEWETSQRERGAKGILSGKGEIANSCWR